MLRTIICAILSACLLVIAYPQIELHVLAWVAFVPLFIILDGKNNKGTFGIAYVYGFAFFFATLGWFVYVTYPGAILLIAYLSVYFGIFGLAFKFFRPTPLYLRLLLLPAFWVCLEFIRSHLLSGFGWAMLGHSQYKNLALIQIADITGVYGVSFVVMLVNYLIFESIKAGRDRKIRPAQAAVFLLLAFCLSYGVRTLGSSTTEKTVTLGVVQPNIPQVNKWDPSYQWWIVQKTIHLSRELEAQKPQMVIWPETSLPGILTEVPALVKDIQMAAKEMKTPLLMGAITQENGHYYNSVYMVSAKGEMAARYDKLHLVPFGEYLPVRPLLGWINRFVPLEDFTPGTEYKLFQGPNDTRFAVLICFEDTLGYLWRNFTNEGAQFMVNMTNDAWFMDTKAPFMHLQPAVFGAIENKRSLVRAANTGFSGFIDPYGRIIESAKDQDGRKTFVSAVATATIPINNEKTFYTKYGDVFTYVCLLGILWGVINRRKYA